MNMPTSIDSASDVPVVAIDGPAASGKGTVAARVAATLGFAYLDSGALYRLVALKAALDSIPVDDVPALSIVASQLDVRFDAGEVWLDGNLVTDAIRAERISSDASRVAAHGPVRQALLARQRAFRRSPGLVAEGRDMGTVVFPDARLKVFLTASPEVRAERRHKQLIGKGLDASIQALLQEIRERDERDSSRSAAPLKPAVDAEMLDTTSLDIEQSVDFVLRLWRSRQQFGNR
jgi:cytidylate kinase